MPCPYLYDIFKLIPLSINMTTSTYAAAKATETKTTFSKTTSVGININATPQRIWGLLTNAADFSRWNSTVESIEGNIAQGEKIKLRAKIAPGRVFNLAIKEFVPSQKLVWADGMAPMFSGVRTFTLTPNADGSTHFSMSETIKGLMMPMIAGSLPDFRQSYDQYAADLKAEAEGR